MCVCLCVLTITMGDTILRIVKFCQLSMICGWFKTIQWTPWKTVVWQETTNYVIIKWLVLKLWSEYNSILFTVNQTYNEKTDFFTTRESNSAKAPSTWLQTIPHRCHGNNKLAIKSQSVLKLCWSVSLQPRPLED